MHTYYLLSYTNSSRLGHGQKVRNDSSHTNEVSSKKAKEGNNSTDGCHDLYEFTISFGKYVRKSKCVVLVDFARKKDGVVDER